MPLKKNQHQSENPQKREKKMKKLRECKKKKERISCRKLSKTSSKKYLECIYSEASTPLPSHVLHPGLFTLLMIKQPRKPLTLF